MHTRILIRTSFIMDKHNLSASLNPLFLPDSLITEQAKMSEQQNPTKDH